MDHKKGIATVFRGNEALGVVEYDFNMTDNGRVTGWIVEVKHMNVRPMAPRVPPTFLQKSAGAADLHLSLGDGTGGCVPCCHHRWSHCERAPLSRENVNDAVS